MPRSHSIRALLVTTDFPPDVGGLQAYSFRLARDLPGGFLKHVLIGSDHRENAPISIPGLEATFARGRTRWRAFFWSMRHVIRLHFTARINFQIHMQWSTAIPSLLMKKIGLRSDYVVLIHGAELLDPGRWFLNWIKTVILSHADAVVAGSAHTAEILRQRKGKYRRLEIIHYGNPLEGGILSDTKIDSEPESTALSPSISSSERFGANPINLLCMHRLVARKGTALLLDALSQLQATPWSLTVVGTGEEEPRLKEQARKLGIGHRVIFSPPVSESQKVALLAQASLFILPSLPPDGNNFFEGLGLTLLEAQSLGTPVFAARTGGIPEALREGETGALFRAGDPKDLRDQLDKLLQSPKMLESMGRAGPQWVKSHFSWKTSLEKLSGLIEEVAGTR